MLAFNLNKSISFNLKFGQFPSMLCVKLNWYQTEHADCKTRFYFKNKSSSSLLEFSCEFIPNRRNQCFAEWCCKIFGTLVLDSNEGLTLKPNAIKDNAGMLRWENNHHDSLAGKGQDGNDCSLIIELPRQLFYCHSVINQFPPLTVAFSCCGSDRWKILVSPRSVLNSHVRLFMFFFF